MLSAWNAIEHRLRAAGRPLARDEADQILRDLREIVGDRAPGRFVLVVQDAALRSSVQHLCERILPSVAVVAQAEMDRGDGARVEALGAV
jgi:flagellar biosynthesis component FlhA